MVPPAAAGRLVSATTPPVARVGRYRLVARIGAGGMATVFLARAEGLGGFERDVAVKLLHEHLRENDEIALQLVNEARIAAKIRHPNVVQVHDVGEDPAGIFLVMEYVEGDTLSALSRAARRAGETVPPSIALRILADALAGLHSAHQLCDSDGRLLEIVHRDFSPQNILVGTDGNTRLTDFGIAKAASHGGHTRPGLIKGKIAYMSPEQARGKTVDRRCDVWAAGVVAWELLSGRPLRADNDEVAALLEVVSGDPPDLRAVAPQVSQSLAAAVASALTSAPDQRCPTAAELRRRLLEAWRDQGGELADDVDVAAYVKRCGHLVEELRTVRPANPDGEATDRDSVRPAASTLQIPLSGGLTLEGATDQAGRAAMRPVTATLPSLGAPVFAPRPQFAPPRRRGAKNRLGWARSVTIAGALAIMIFVSARNELSRALGTRPVARAPSLSAPPPTNKPHAPDDSTRATVAGPRDDDAVANGLRADVDRGAGWRRSGTARNRKGESRKLRAQAAEPSRAGGAKKTATARWERAARGTELGPAPSSAVERLPPPLAGNPYVAPSP